MRCRKAHRAESFREKRIEVHSELNHSNRVAIPDLARLVCFCLGSALDRPAEAVIARGVRSSVNALAAAREFCDVAGAVLRELVRLLLLVVIGYRVLPWHPTALSDHIHH